MPLLKIQTNVSIDPHQQGALLSDATRCVSDALGKPEQYVMIVLDVDRPIMFAANEEPAAFLELRSIGLPQDRTPDLSRTLCGLLETSLGIPANRVFINFADVPRASWGWDSRTF